MHRPIGLAASALAAGMLLAACGSGTGTPAASAPVDDSPAAPVATPAPDLASGTPASSASEAAGCETADGTAGTTAEIEGFAFPSGLSVAAGEAVTWTNRDSVPHTATLEDGSCDSGTIPAGGSRTVTYAVPGSYALVCRIHPNMSGTIEVR